MRAAGKILIIIIGGLVILTAIYSHISPYNSEESRYQIKTIFENVTDENTKVILYWTPMFTMLDFNLGLGEKIFENCTYKNCYTTHNGSYRPVEKFDAILFHGVEYRESTFGKPQKRDPKQIYVFSNQESPLNTPHYIGEYNNFYNWTMTYRLDSDILRPYGFIEKKETGYEPPSIEDIQKRPKKIAWFVSNCATASQRELLYKELRRHVQIDAYGICGDMRCPKETSDECYDMVEKNYKFYLAFENSLCEDYVTEKMFNVLKRNIVPIVFGGADYNTLAPPKSVINVMDYTSVKDLVQYIRFLDTNPEEYLKFFEWKKNYIIDSSNKLTLCSLCKKLHEPIKPKTYNDLVTWWNGPNSDKCYSDFINVFL